MPLYHANDLHYEGAPRICRVTELNTALALQSVGVQYLDYCNELRYDHGIHGEIIDITEWQYPRIYIQL